MNSEKGNQKTRATFIIEADLLAEFKKKAEAENLTMSHLIRLFMKDYIQNGKGVKIDLN